MTLKSHGHCFFFRSDHIEKLSNFLSHFSSKTFESFNPSSNKIMKASLKLEDQHQNQNPLLFKAKIPIDVFGVPFLSAFSATHHHTATTSDHLSLSLRTHFPAGPSLKLSYNTPITTTTSTTTAVAAAATAPFTLTLKSGVSLSGSPDNSPLVISANLAFSPQNPNPNPTFSIHFKPRLGSFSLRKSISSTISNSSKKVNGNGSNGGENSYGFVPLDRSNILKELRVESDAKHSILSGILMAADTELPVTKRVKLNLRWGLSIPSDYEKQLPYLRLNKIKIARIDDTKEEDVNQKQTIEGGSGEFEVLKGMCTWMTSELNDLRKENREMRRTLDEMESRQSFRNRKGYNGSGGEKKRVVFPVVENSGGFEQWRMKKKGQRETKNEDSSTDVESELQKAIKTASSQ